MPTQFSHRSRLPLTLLLAALPWLAVAPARPADPFYAGLLESGARALARGDHAEAARHLRIACFGLLEEPPLLAEGLARLAVARIALGDADGFTDAARRLLEVEALFDGYSASELDAAERRAFEQALLDHLPAAELEASPTFAPRVAEREASRLAALPPRERRLELESGLARAPGDAALLLQLAELELADGRTRQAVDWLDRLLAAEPENAKARCLRGAATVDGNRCAEAVADLELCAAGTVGTEVAVARLDCLVKLRRWEGAAAVLAELPAATRAATRVARLATRVERETVRLAPRTDGEAVEVGTPPPAVGTTPAATPTAAAGSGLPEPGAADRTELEAVTGRLNAVPEATEIPALLARARALAERRPDWPEAQFLAAQLAYHATAWDEAVRFFERGGEPGDERPALLFYWAVALHESGRPQAAAVALERALPGIEPSEFVRGWAERIRHSADDGAP